MNKTSQVLNYIKNHKRGITSMEAFEKFGATRLSAIIFVLRKNHEIVSITEEGVDRYGHEVRYARYVWKGEK